MRIGIVDLDTSHPGSFAPLLAQRGQDVVAVFGGDTVVDDAYTRTYAAEHGIPTVVDDPTDLIGQVDAVFLHSVNWDTHVDRLRPFVEAGVPAKVCKPFAGNAADIRQLVEWVEGGARIAGGSALRWSATARRLADDVRAIGDGPLSLCGVTFGHVLDYGIHLFSLLHGIVGPGMEAVRALDADGVRAQVRWENGRTAVAEVLPPGDAYGFYVTLGTTRGVEHVDAAGDDLYGPFLDVTLANLGGEERPVPFAQLVEPELAIIGARASAAHGGDWIALRGDDRIDDGSFDGSAFARGYAEKRRAALGIS